LGVVENQNGLVLLDGRKVVFKDKGVIIVWVLEVGSVGAGVGGAEVAVRVVGRVLCEVVLLLFALPGPLCPVWGAEDPGVGQRIEATVRVMVKVENLGRGH
jgi:hypothetical protein